MIIAHVFAFLFGLFAIPIVLGLTRIFGLFAVVGECQAHVYTLFGKVLGTLDEPGLRFPMRRFGMRSLLIPFFGITDAIDSDSSWAFTITALGGMNTDYQRNPFAPFGATGNMGIDLKQIMFGEESIPRKADAIEKHVARRKEAERLRAEAEEAEDKTDPGKRD